MAMQPKGVVPYMTTHDDVKRQIETALSDRCCPPTPREREVFARILSSIHAGAADARGSR